MRNYTHWLWIIICFIVHYEKAIGQTLLAPGFGGARLVGTGTANEGSVVIGAAATDAAGNVYVTGTLSGTQHFGAFTLSTQQGFPPAMGVDTFVAKLDSAGVVLWAVCGGSGSDDHGNGIALDGLGNVYITGEYLGTAATFGNATLRNTGTGDLYVASLNSTGQWRWATGGGGRANAAATALAISAAGELYITGALGYVAASTVVSIGPFAVTNTGGYEIFAAQLSNAGAWRWVTTAAGGGYDFARRIAVDSQGNAYLTGSFESRFISFGPTTLTRLPAVAGEASDLFVASLNANGNWRWAVSGGSTDIDQGVAIMTDRQGNSYITGSFRGNAAFGPLRVASAGGADIVTASLTSTGNWRWAAAGGGTADERGETIVVDDAGGCYVAGSFGSVFGATIAFGTSSLSNAGLTDAFLVRYDPTGLYQWAVSAGGSSYDGCSGLAFARNRLHLVGGTQSMSARFAPYAVQANPNTYGYLESAWIAWLPLPRAGLDPASANTAVFLPNIITPNQDGFNDIFSPKLPFGHWSITIYSRWGRLAHQADFYENNWGPNASSGLYYYLLRDTITGQSYKGWVEVIQ